MGVDASELIELAADLGRPLDDASIAEAVRESTEAIQKQLQAEASKSRHFKFAPRITTTRKGKLEYETGPLKGGAGSLAHIAYFGGANGGGGTVPDPTEAMEAEAPQFVDRVVEAAIEGML